MDWCHRRNSLFSASDSGNTESSSFPPSSQSQLRQYPVLGAPVPHSGSSVSLQISPHLSSTFHDSHPYLKQYLQDLNSHPPVLPTFLALSVLGPSTPSRNNNIVGSIVMNDFGPGPGGFRGPSLGTLSAHPQSSSSGPMRLQSSSSFGTGQTQEPVYNIGSFERPAHSYPDSHRRLQPPYYDGTGPWLPDIYSFSTVDGIGVENRYKPALAPPTPFMPSSPRVDENEKVNFEYGALTTDLEETSYMAWF